MELLLLGMLLQLEEIYIFFFNDTATTEIYTLSLHDALPIYPCDVARACGTGRHPSPRCPPGSCGLTSLAAGSDRKSTRLNSSHSQISYAVFCLKKKINFCMARPSRSERKGNRRAFGISGCTT